MFINEVVPDLLLLEREVDSVISCAETEVSRYELATNLAVSDPDSDFDMDDDTKVMLTNNSHIFSFLLLFFKVKAYSTLRYRLEQGVCYYVINEILNST